MAIEPKNDPEFESALARCHHPRCVAQHTPRAKTKDPGIVVVDEVIGQWIAIAGAHPINWKSCLGAFVLFRLFDIWKPPPVRQLEGLREALGIVADDAMAGTYAALVLFLAGWLHWY